MSISKARPHWADPSNYPKLKASPNYWAWEFLRRNPEYRNDFEAANAEPEKRVGAHRDLRKKWGLWIAWHPDNRNPLRSDIVLMRRAWDLKIITYKEKDGECITAPWVPESPNQAAVILDLSRPIRPQIKKAKFLLAVSQRNPLSVAPDKRRRIKPKEMLEKLQVWDARQCGTTYEEIADWLFPNNDNRVRMVEERLCDARRLIEDREYQSLVR